MRKSVAILCLLLSYSMFAQLTNSDYKYVIVPSKFKFLASPNQYNLNTLTKLYFEKYGFKVYFDEDVLPLEIADTRCDKLYAEVNSSGNFINTKLQVTLKDCTNKTRYESKVGKSKEKAYNVAYTQALREAFQSFNLLDNTKTITPKTPKNKPAAVIVEKNIDDNLPLQAKPIANGYEFTDAASKVVMKVYKTSNPNMYTAVKGNISGVLISKDNAWFFEYYEHEKLVSEKINVKF